MNAKKIFSIIPICVFLIFLSGCDKLTLQNKNNTEQTKPNNSQNTDTSSNAEPSPSHQKDNTDTVKTSKYTIKDYYPFKENTKYTFEGKGNEYASYTIYVDYIKGDRIQTRKNNGGTEVASVLENKNGELKLVFSREETYFREDFTSKASNKDELLLKEPLVKGTTWTLSDGRKRYISNLDVEVITPAGSFKALEVTTEGNNYKNLDYYALNTGLVKTVYTSNGMQVTSTLKELKSNTSLTQTVKFYYPSINDDKLYFSQKKLIFKTNDITKLTFEKILKETPSKNVGRLIGPNVKIKSLYVNGNIVYIDFSKELITEMNAGSSYEALILQGIANTIGEYYGVNKVYITVEGKPYESGHISMKKGETFTVDTKGSVQLK
jgi:hypothetical protein